MTSRALTADNLGVNEVVSELLQQATTLISDPNRDSSGSIKFRVDVDISRNKFGQIVGVEVQGSTPKMPKLRARATERVGIGHDDDGVECLMQSPDPQGNFEYDPEVKAQNAEQAAKNEYAMRAVKGGRG